jgi:hypothetical protein
MVLQRDHPDDLAARVIAILAVIHGDRSEAGRIVRIVIWRQRRLARRTRRLHAGTLFQGPRATLPQASCLLAAPVAQAELQRLPLS